MDCKCCNRNDVRRKYYCSGCISQRLSQHSNQRHLLSQSLLLESSKATNVLLPLQGSTLFGGKEERELKAEKFSLAVRIRQERLGVDFAKEKLLLETSELASRKASLAHRRQNLKKAQELLDNLASPIATTSKVTLESLSSLEVNRKTLQKQLDALHREIHQIQSKKLFDLSTVYNFQPSESSSGSPFQSSGSLKGLQSTIHTLSISNLSTLSSLPPIQLTTLLSHLSHLLRLVTLYLFIALPYTIEQTWNRSTKEFELEGKKEKGRLILENVIRLAFNLAFVLWKRGEVIIDSELDDLGELVRRVLDFRDEPKLRKANEIFPIKFDSVLEQFKSRMDVGFSGDEDWDLV